MNYIFNYLYNGIVEFINSVIENISNILPVSPFAPYIRQLESVPWIGIVNYFVPIGAMLDILLAWVTALGVFYVYSIILRWIKVVGE